ncbi:hypothetical protein FHW36_10531 [Chitinophaga polysaccharea]|uniref:Uncharacterized protein n=1 Tax=Chitinophaga polysaccharea TaxID=1293035 RepID=A0A561PNA5_9BACT|nr:hypothetical protein [Chitinophaga polysaccharea]TWF39594.1 hypothetical protein FHW36_10531 [Chitinophaga polysaccharea]
MNELLLQTIVDKLNKVDEGIRQINSTAPQTPDYTEQLKGVGTSLEQIKTDVAGIPERMKFPSAAVYALSQHLEVNNDLLKRPPIQEIKHHHHLHAGVIVSACLFMLLVLGGVWLFNTRSMLQDYKAGDIKYRYVLLQAGKPLRPFLSKTDSLYHINPQAFRDSVIKWEDERERIAAMLREAREKEEEAGQLRNRAGKIR